MLHSQNATIAVLQVKQVGYKAHRTYAQFFNRQLCLHECVCFLSNPTPLVISFKVRYWEDIHLCSQQWNLHVHSSHENILSVMSATSGLELTQSVMSQHSICLVCRCCTDLLVLLQKIGLISEIVITEGKLEKMWWNTSLTVCFKNESRYEKKCPHKLYTIRWNF